MTRFITIASAKGGVGKTTTAVNTALALSHAGKNVILLDADMTVPATTYHLGVETPEHTLHDVLEGKKSIQDVLYAHSSGLRLIPSSNALKWQSTHKKKLSEALLDLVGKAEIVIIDSSATLGEHTLAALKPTDETIIVTNPDLPSVMAAKKTVLLAQETGSVVAGIVVNRLQNRSYEIPIEEIASLTRKPVLAAVPEDRNIPKAISMRKPLLQAFPSSKASKEFRHLADLLNI
ncbi:P-loop NTPase [Candidatus Woesearchaeota archaeon]|nr:P-loop NTPase [Candidatus Woesearchaeota archaeon]